MARYFFSGGTMPSADLLLHFQVRALHLEAFHTPMNDCASPLIRGIPSLGHHRLRSALVTPIGLASAWVSTPQDDLAIQKQWYINGVHYSRTLEAWLQRMDAQRKEIMPIFQVRPPAHRQSCEVLTRSGVATAHGRASHAKQWGLAVIHRSAMAVTW